MQQVQVGEVAVERGWELSKAAGQLVHNKVYYNTSSQNTSWNHESKSVGGVDFSSN